MPSDVSDYMEKWRRCLQCGQGGGHITHTGDIESEQCVTFLAFAPFIVPYWKKCHSAQI